MTLSLNYIVNNLLNGEPTEKVTRWKALSEILWRDKSELRERD